MLGFRQYYQEFYQSRTFLVTPADEPRLAVHAYQDYRRYVGLPRRITDTQEAQEQRIRYHLGAYELAEIVGDARCAESPWEAFLRLWSRYLYTLRSGDAGQDKPAIPGWRNEFMAGLRFIAKRFECPIAEIRIGPMLRCRQIIDRVEEACCLRIQRPESDGLLHLTVPQ
jgi:hypothetical protein